MRVLFFFLILIASNIAIAQGMGVFKDKDGNTYEFELTMNDPYQVPSMLLIYHLPQMEMKANLAIVGGVYGYFSLSDKLWLNGRIDYAFFEELFENTNYQRSKRLNFGAEYKLFDRVKNKSIAVGKPDREKLGIYNVFHFSDALVNRPMFARAGVFYQTNNVTSSFIERELSFSNGDTIIHGATSVEGQNGFYVGVSIKETKNIAATVEKYGKIKRVTYWDAYIDLMFALTFWYSDFHDPVIPGAFKVDGENGFKFSGIGLRVGTHVLHIKYEGLDITLGLEAGRRPTTIGFGGYFQASFAVTHGR